MSTIRRRIVNVAVGPPGGSGTLFAQEYITASVKSFRGSKPNEATVTINNLSMATIAALEAPGQTLIVRAGEDVPGQIFVGQVARRGVVTEVQSPDRVTTITARDGRRVYRDTTVAMSYPPGTPVATVVQDLLARATAQGLTLGVGSSYPAGSLPSGWAHQGAWRHALTELLEPRKYMWTIQGGVIYVQPESAVLPGNTPVLVPDTGLVGSPRRTDKGCDVVSTLNPGIVAGRAVQVASQFFAGLYRAATVEHVCASDGSQWETRAQLELIK